METKEKIFGIEKSLLEWVESHLLWFALAAVTALSILSRISLHDFVSLDCAGALIPWYELIAENGLREQVGNYNLAYQFLIWLMTKLPIDAVAAYKLVSCIFDFLLAFGVGWLTYCLTTEHRQWKAFAAYGAVLLSPIVILNSAAWAQCDSIYTCFAVFAILSLLKERYVMAMIFFGLSFAFKLQAIFLLPLLLFLYFVRKNFSILYFLLIPLIVVATCIPTLFWGRNLVEVLSIYLQQTNEFPQMILTYPSVWTFLVDGDSLEHFLDMKYVAILSAFAALLGWILVWIKKKVHTRGIHLVMMAFLLVYTCVLLLPSMHDRYGYVYEILAIVLAVCLPKTIPLCAALIGLSLCTYNKFLFRAMPVELFWLTVINLIVYFVYAWIFWKEMSREACSSETLTDEQIQ